MNTDVKKVPSALKTGVFAGVQARVPFLSVGGESQDCDLLVKLIFERFPVFSEIDGLPEVGAVEILSLIHI